MKQTICKVCGTEFNLNKAWRYTVSAPHILMVLAHFDATDCPHCGCQIILGKRLMPVEGKAETPDTIHMGGHDWRILKRKDGKALIITEKVIDKRRFDGESNDWKTSEIKQWLNGEFLEMFSLDERKRIDKVFLLSVKQAEKYFKDDADRVAVEEDGNRVWWWLRSPDVCGFEFVNSTALVMYDGFICPTGFSANCGVGGIRPAMWITL